MINRALVTTWRLLFTGSLVVAVSNCGGSTANTPSKDAGRDASTTAAPVARAAVPGRIAFRRFSDHTQTSAALFTSAADGSNERQLTHPPTSVVDDEPDWSPDGTRLVFTRNTADGPDLFTVSSDGTRLTPVSKSRPKPANGTGAGDNAAVFSPDGKHIAFGTYHGHVATAGEHGVVSGDQIEFSDIAVMDANGSHRRQVTNFAAYSGDAGGVAWSPDGKQLAYARSNGGSSKPPGARALFIINVDGTHNRQITPWSLGANGTPDWSSAANLIVFRAVVNEESGVGNFFTVRPDGTALTQITHFIDTVISHKVGFSPDGRWIVFAKAPVGESNDVYTAKADGSDVRALTKTPQADSSPDWGP
jgi:Tol biopolymer transport system component